MTNEERKRKQLLLFIKKTHLREQPIEQALEKMNYVQVNYFRKNEPALRELLEALAQAEKPAALSHSSGECTPEP